ELSPPQPLAPSGGADWKGDDPLAYIDLVARQVYVNLPLLVELGARESLTAVLAHELGHHVRWPHTLGVAAHLQLLEQRLIRGVGQSLTNGFVALLVSEGVGRTRGRELADVYRGFNRRAAAGTGMSPFGWFYLAVYEELWGPPAGPMVAAGSDAEMEKKFP